MTDFVVEDDSSVESRHEVASCSRKYFGSSLKQDIAATADEDADEGRL